MWARDMELAIGLWLAMSPFVFGHPGADTALWANDLACAALVAVLAVSTYWRPMRRAHLAELAVAAWLVGWGWSTAYQSAGAAPPASQNHVVVGLLLGMLAIVPSRASEPPAAWRGTRVARRAPGTGGEPDRRSSREQGVGMKVQELMTEDVQVCHPSGTLEGAAQLMMEHDCGAIPVVREGSRRVVGMLTDRDICMSAYRQGRSLKEIRVEDAMSRDVRTCAPGDDHASAEKTMRDAQVRRIPVVEDGELRGILTFAQIARAAGDGRGAGISQDEVGSTLAAIVQPTEGPRADA